MVCQDGSRPTGACTSWRAHDRLRPVNGMASDLDEPAEYCILTVLEDDKPQ
jgi:hypothetical protein